MESNASLKSSAFRLLADSILFLISILFLSRLAFEQGFPLLYSDTVAYIVSGHDVVTPVDRPLAYGLFMNFFSLGKSLFFVVITQAAILSWLIRRACSLFLGSYTRLSFVHVLICALLSLLSGVSWYVSMLIPDVFTPVLILAIILVLFHPRDRSTPLDVFLGTLALPMHSSHVVFVGLLFLIFIFFLLTGFRARLRALRPRILALSLMLSTGIILGMVLNKRGGAPIEFSRGSHMFVVARLCGNGILKDYLKEKCAASKSSISLCKRVNSLPEKSDVFLWSDSVYYDADCIRKGGWGLCWEKRRQEYLDVFRDVLCSYPYNLRFLIQTIQNTGEQLLTFRVDPLMIETDKVPYEFYLNQFFPSDLPRAKASEQWQEMVQFEKLDRCQNVLLAICFLFLLLLLFAMKSHQIPFFRSAFLLLLALIFANAFICGAFSDVVPRYQGRVIWLIPLFALLSLVSLVRSKLKLWSH